MLFTRQPTTVPISMLVDGSWWSQFAFERWRPALLAPVVDGRSPCNLFYAYMIINVYLKDWKRMIRDLVRPGVVTRRGVMPRRPD